ncbi:MAG: hypothetical protein ACM3XM_00065 [Mycobacterium leprae]
MPDEKSMTVGQITSGGICHPNYFNGRLLAAEDLALDQQATETHLTRLGRVAGAGIASGLSVGRGSGSTVLNVGQGVAINSLGESLELSQSVQLELNPPAQAGTYGAGGFSPCSPNQTQSHTAPSDGLYLLVVGPTTRVEGSVPVSGLVNPDAIATCGRRYIREGVAFRLLYRGKLPDAKSRPALRWWNVKAHEYLGSDALAHKPMLGAQAFALDQATAQGKWLPVFDVVVVIPGAEQIEEPTEHEVGLTLLSWENGKIGELDMWAVRRQLALGDPRFATADSLFPARYAAGEAIFRQYGNRPFASNLVTAASTFTPYLPAAGYLPQGYSATVFLGGLNVWKRPLSPTMTDDLLSRSFLQPPIPTDGSDQSPVGYADMGDAGIFFWRLDPGTLPPRCKVAAGKAEVTDEFTISGRGVVQTYEGSLTIRNDGGPGFVWCTGSVEVTDANGGKKTEPFEFVVPEGQKANGRVWFETEGIAETELRFTFGIAKSQFTSAAAVRINVVFQVYGAPDGVEQKDSWRLK